MGKLLSTNKRLELIRTHRETRDGRTRDRIKAVLMHDNGYSYSEIAKVLLLDDETIRRHIDDYLAENKLSPENGGSTSALNIEETRALKEHLKEKTYARVKDICEYVKLKYGIIYSVSGITHWLKSNGFCYKKPQGIPGRLEIEAQEKFIKKYKRLSKKDTIKEPVLFMDSVHPQYQSQCAYGWFLKGERVWVKKTAHQPHLNIIGCISLNNYHFEHTEVKENINADSIMIFLKQVSRAYPLAKKIHIILDRAGYHRDKKVIAFARRHRIKLHFLPAYSPNLNPIERLWKIMREKVMHNRFYEKFAEFKDSIRAFLKSVSKIKSILKKRLTDNFQTFSDVKFAS